MTARTSFVTAARIIDEHPETVRSWRHKRLGPLGEIGEPSGRDLLLELREVMLLALVSALNNQNRPLEVSAAVAPRWLDYVDLVATGQLGADDRNVYAVEARYPDGHVTRYVADGVDQLQEAMAAVAGSAAISVLNLSELVARVQTGWIIATRGVDAARADYLTHLHDVPEGERAALLAEFDRVASRVAPPPRLKRAGRVTANGTFAPEATPEPVQVLSKPRVKA